MSSHHLVGSKGQADKTDSASNGLHCQAAVATAGTEQSFSKHGSVTVTTDQSTQRSSLSTDSLGLIICFSQSIKRLETDDSDQKSYIYICNYRQSLILSFY